MFNDHSNVNNPSNYHENRYKAHKCFRFNSMANKPCKFPFDRYLARRYMNDLLLMGSSKPRVGRGRLQKHGEKDSHDGGEEYLNCSIEIKLKNMKYDDLQKCAFFHKEKKHLKVYAEYARKISSEL